MMDRASGSTAVCGMGGRSMTFMAKRKRHSSGIGRFSNALDTSAWEGMPGQLRFVYETGDSCCGFERGWFIDDLSFAAFCDDEPFPP